MLACTISTRANSQCTGKLQRMFNDHQVLDTLVRVSVVIGQGGARDSKSDVLLHYGLFYNS